MATRNHGNFISRSIESVLNQSFQDWELIIVNDGSTDNTGLVVKQFRAKDKRIIYLDNGKNLGVSKSFNRALAIAKGKYIARIDSDDAWIGKDKLKKQVEFLKAHPDYVAVGGGMIVVNPGGKELFRYLKSEQDKDIRATALVTNPIANSTSVCRRDVIIKAGLCDESLDYNEDWDFWLKIGLLGKFYNFPEYFSYYTMTGRNKSVVYLRRHTAAALNIIWKFRRDYSNFLKGFFINLAQFFYGCVPFKIRFFFHVYLSKLKKKFSGSKIENEQNRLFYDGIVSAVKKNKSPLVSIIMPTYNRADKISKAIESVIGQTFKNWELIIIDDASLDETSQVVKEWQKRFPSKIIFVRNKTNIYPDISAILNQAAALAKGKYIARIDDDDWWCNPVKLEIQVGFLENYPDYVVCGGGMKVVDLKSRSLFSYFKPEMDFRIRQMALFANPFAHTTVMYTKAAFQKVGGYGNWVYAEDWDLWLKLGKIGKLYNFSDYFTVYTMSYKNKSFVYQRQQAQTIFQIIKKHRLRYPNFYFAYAFNIAQYAYSLLPVALRKFFHFPLSYFKNSSFN
ncbi:MAG: glycosyltransferase [Patescibacteria group bacterium]